MSGFKSSRASRGAVALAIFVGLISLQWVASARAGALPAGSVVGGKTLGEWSADWWAWALSYSIKKSPLLDDTGRLGRLGKVPGPVFFLVSSGGGRMDKKHDVPAGKYLFVPLYTYVWTYDDYCHSEHCARQIADGAVMAVTSLTARIDGVPVKQMFSHYETSPAVFKITVPDDGLYGPGEGGTFKAVTSGYWLMIEPLSPGKHHIFVDAVGPIDDTQLIHFTTRLDLNVVSP